jgi:hypothetical protein
LLIERGFVKSRSTFWLFVFLFSAICSAAQRGPEKSSSGEEFVGVWSGSWQATGSSGGFELTLEKNKDGGDAGRVSVTGEPTYKASFKALSFDGNKMNAKYDFPPSEADAEVWLTATFDGNKANGTWSLRVKADGSEVAAGTWSVTKK